MLIFQKVGRYFIVAHGLVTGPVVLCPVDAAIVQGRVHLAVDHLHRHRAHIRHHLTHHVRFLHPDDLALQIDQCRGLFPGVKAADTGIEPRKPHQIHIFQRGEEPIPDAAVQHPPHLLGILVKVRQLQHAQVLQQTGQLAEGDTGKINAAKLHLLNDAQLSPQLSAAVHHHFYPAIRPPGHHLGKGQRSLGGGVILRLVLRIAEDELRLRLCRRGLRCRAAGQGPQCRTGRAHQQAAAGDACFPLHKWASADFLPACRRYWVGVIPVRFLKARAK